MMGELHGASWGQLRQATAPESSRGEDKALLGGGCGTLADPRQHGTKQEIAHLPIETPSLVLESLTHRKEHLTTVPNTKYLRPWALGGACTIKYTFSHSFRVCAIPRTSAPPFAAGQGALHFVFAYGRTPGFYNFVG
jgi:hypothetical protein